MSRSLIAALAAGIAVWTGCFESGPGESPEIGLLQATPDLDQELDAEALRALGYLAEAADVPAEAPVGVLRSDPSRARSGIDFVTLASTCSAHTAAPGGPILRRWSYPRCAHWSNGFLSDTGEFVVVHSSPLPAEATLEQAIYEHTSILKFDWDGELLWETELPVHHDVSPMPDGRIAALTRRLEIYPAIHPTYPVREHGIVILSASGVPVEQAWLMPIMARSPDYQPIPAGMIGGKARRTVNTIHANTINWMDSDALAAKDPFYSKDNLLVTMRAQNAVVLIHWPSRQIVWSWGHGELIGPHDGHVLPSGNILIFDNGNRTRRSRIVELDPLAKEIVWQYKGHDFYSKNRSAAQRLANGNTLVTVSDSAEAFEVTPEGELVWEFRNPINGPNGKPDVIVRIRNYLPGDDDRPPETVD